MPTIENQNQLILGNTLLLKSTVQKQYFTQKHAISKRIFPTGGQSHYNNNIQITYIHTLAMEHLPSFT